MRRPGRLGEILGLEWSDLDFTRELMKVQRAVYEGDEPVVTLPKGGKPRIVPMTARLKRALAAHRHLRGDRDIAERRAGLRKGGRVRILRHTFCSRLAARNVAMLSIKELAGHQSLETTQRYMHLSSAAPREAIAALDSERGDVVETEAGAEKKRCGDA